MLALKTELLNILNILALHPANNAELAIITTLSLIAAVFIIKAAAKPLGFTMAYADRASVCVLGTYAVSILSVAALRVFVFPKVPDSRVQIAITAVVLLIILFAVAMTLCKMVMKGGYFTSLAPIIFSVVAAGVIAMAAKYTIGTIKDTAKGFGKTKDRTEAINKEIPR